jgi:hypothetical protein
VQKQTHPLVTLAVLALAGWLIFGDGQGCSLPLVPVVNPPPFKADKLCVLVVEETTDRNTYTAGQREVILSTAGVREYVKAKGGEFYTLDDDTPLDKAAPWVQEAMKAAQPNQLPWIVAATPSAGFTKQLPKEASETLADVQKLGGPVKTGSSYHHMKAIGVMP